ncbi:Cysteine protease family C48 [Phytophthora palmivora]|uniref:Cysteine protease family C48 n=1 Tax=Phytophthora palmivora TaxID=4796 RepID=A0A2P4XDD0_9STRA|nr:Cysteine protease family C48 [Phytophthora palmivora]
MRAAGVFLGQYKNNSTTMIPPPKDSKTKRLLIYLQVRFTGRIITVEAIVSAVVARKFTLQPINLGGQEEQEASAERSRSYHWALTVKDYTTCDVKETIQKDSNNCGVYICFFFWSCVNKDVLSEQLP